MQSSRSQSHAFNNSLQRMKTQLIYKHNSIHIKLDDSDCRIHELLNININELLCGTLCHTIYMYHKYTHKICFKYCICRLILLQISHCNTYVYLRLNSAWLLCMKPFTINSSKKSERVLLGFWLPCKVSSFAMQIISNLSRVKILSI